METLIIDVKSKKEKEVLTAFLNSLKIGYYTEKDEDIALVKAYDKAKAKKEKPIPFDAAKLKK